MNINRFVEKKPALAIGLGGCDCNIVRHMAEAEKMTVQEQGATFVSCWPTPTAI